MEDANQVKINALLALLTQKVEVNRADLVSRYRQVLQETLFANRSEVRPAMLGRIAAEEADALLSFFLRPLLPGLEHGAQLCQMGLSEQTVLRLGQATRQFFVTRLENDLLAPALDAIDTYQNAVIEGFVQSREKVILIEQERIRSALQRAIGRYTVEIKEIQDMAQKATEANEFKSRFIARMSHEVRTPLGALMGMSEMLQENVYGPLTPAQQDIAKRIINNAHALEQVFTDLLDQSQIELGQLRLKEEAFSPRILAQTVHSTCLPLALRKELVMRVEVDPELPHLLIGDKRKIEQVLTNLVVNAIKFTETGSVVLRVRKDGDTHWALQVRDTGIGIAKEAQAYIFEPFRQVDETMSREYGGVGLGLSIVKQLAAAMNGTVTVESKVGQGSTFTVLLPLRLTVPGN